MQSHYEKEWLLLSEFPNGIWAVIEEVEWKIGECNEPGKKRLIQTKQTKLAGIN